MNVATVVVTFNRRALLEGCLRAIAGQSRPSDSVFVVDNASTDGTAAWLQQWLPLHLPNAEMILMPDNSGGAGGFARGLGEAVKAGADWVWMMDDDAVPWSDALEKLLAITDDPANIYGSIAVKGEDTSWLTTLIDENHRSVNKAADVPGRARVKSLPFLGFMIHRSLVAEIGLPDPGFFIAADDTEYCMRAQIAGADIIIAGLSRIEHPKSDTYIARLPFRSVVYLRLAPWKRYYDTRNRLLIARQYYGLRMITQTIPGSFVRLFVALLHEPDKLAQTWAFFAGTVDGLLGRKGQRHIDWGIST